jgi:hypothetical protein
MNKTIKINEKFNSFEEFYPLFEKYCLDNYCNFCRSDASYERNDDKQITKINYITFSFVHYKDPSKINSRGTGDREQQCYNAKNCPFKLRLTWSKSKDCYVISQFNDSHDNKHPVTKEYYDMYIKNNKINEDQKQFIHDLYSSKAKPALIKTTVNKRFNTNFNQKQIYNAAKQINLEQFNGEEDDIKKIEAFIEERIKIDGENNFDFTYDTTTTTKK